MNKRIYSYMITLAVLVLVVSGGLLIVAFSGNIYEQMRYGIRSLRVSIIEEDGRVIFDNKTDSEEMDDHSDRPEIAEAREKGVGESDRYSQTEGKHTYYYAIKINNDRILRLAIAADSVENIVTEDVHYIIICVIGAIMLAFILGRRLTEKIISPINSIDVDDPDINIYDELMPFVKRIKTQREEISEQVMHLEKRTETIRTITENMHEGMILLDSEGSVVLHNKMVSSLFGVDDKEGNDIFDLFKEAELKGAVERCLNGFEAETTLERNGRIFDVLCSPVKGGGTVLFIDATEKIKAREQREEFSANVSHELKTPLTSISALSEMIADGTAREEDIRGFAEKINKHAKRLVGTINDVIKLSEFDEASIDEAKTEINLRELAGEVINDLSDKGMENDVRLLLEDGGDITVCANGRMMDELIYNLIDNGIKYNKQGGSVTVRLEKGEEEFTVEVSDTGIGIPAEHMDRVFERFYRVDKSRSRKTGGTGLGLSIVKHIVEYHGGYTEIKSSPEKGTTIRCIMKNKSR